MTAWLLIFYVAGANGGYVTVPGIESEKACLELHRQIAGRLDGAPKCIPYPIPIPFK